MPPADGITVRQKSRAFFQRYRPLAEVRQIGARPAIGTSLARTIACWGEKVPLFLFRLPHSMMLQRLGRSSLPACARYVRKQCFAVRWDIVAAPGDMLIRTNQRVPRFVPLV